jgi:hypothetical protein
VLWKLAGLHSVPPDAASAAEHTLERLQSRAAGGWTPAPLGACMGFVATPWVEGTPLSLSGASPDLLRHLGRYVVAAAGPPLDSAEADTAFEHLEEMLYWNVWEGIGEQEAERVRAWVSGIAPSLKEAEMPRYGDGHMVPHEWLRTPGGTLLKVDADGHDLDHTAVGPQPLLWDAAGTLVEWELSPEAAHPFLEALQAAGAPRFHEEALHFYSLAYAAFRLGQCSLCAQMTGDGEEQSRLYAAAESYRRWLRRSSIGPMPCCP